MPNGTSAYNTAIAIRCVLSTFYVLLNVALILNMHRTNYLADRGHRYHFRGLHWVFMEHELHS